MRIIAGTHRGKKLIEHFNKTTRPTTDRVKENVFNILSNYINIRGLRVLDLFAGTGAYGIECLSRGAGDVHFNDADEEAVKVIKKNISNIWKNIKITMQDYLGVLSSDFDLIFLDPPYDSDLGEKAIEKIKTGFIVFETDKEIENPNIFLTKKYGNTFIYFLKK